MIHSRDNFRPSAHAHHLVHETAVAMAHELYDTMMRDDHWFKYWKKENPGLGRAALEEAFVERNISKLLPQARASLARLLTSGGIDELQKEEIYDALLLDATLVRGRDH